MGEEWGKRLKDAGLLFWGLKVHSNREQIGQARHSENAGGGKVNVLFLGKLGCIQLFGSLIN